jgi:hypothetical protein
MLWVFIKLWGLVIVGVGSEDFLKERKTQYNNFKLSRFEKFVEDKAFVWLQFSLYSFRERDAPLFCAIGFFFNGVTDKKSS